MTPAVRSVTLVGTTSSRGELLRSPVSGAACVHWRLRIVEQLDPRLRLVHEIASPEAFDVVTAGAAESGRAIEGGDGADGGGGATTRVRILPENAEVRAMPVLHRPGSPGAIAAGRAFQLSGALMVEEVLLRSGDPVIAEGALEDRGGASAGPFREIAHERELLGALVRIPGRPSLGPVLLPWALGTAAALLSGVGVATWAARHFDLLRQYRHPVPAPAAEMGPVRPTRRHFSQPE
jgi:hypothetical protein